MTSSRSPAVSFALGCALALAALPACCDCKALKSSGALLSGVFCGGAGSDAPEPAPAVPSACQPRAVMPQFFALLDNGDPALASLRSVVTDLATPVCQVPQPSCTSDDQCPGGACVSGLCACAAEYSPFASLLGYTFSGLASIADPANDPSEPGAVGTPGCLSAKDALKLPPAQRNRLCEVRRALDVLLQQNGGQRLLDDPDVRQVGHALFDYLQGKPPFERAHYDLVEGLGKLVSVSSASCDPGATWTLLDKLLGFLSPAAAQQQLAAVQALLRDPATKAFLAQISQSGSASGRESVIVLAHALTPALLAARSGSDLVGSLQPLVAQVDSGSFPQSFKDEVHAVLDNTAALLAPATGVLPPLQKIIACAASAPVRCGEPSSCTDRDDELLGALYDVLSLPQAQGGLDLATLVGAMKTLASLDQTGQAARTLRMMVEGIQGSDDPNDPHDVRDAVSALAAQALSAREARKLIPAVELLVDRQVVSELFSLLQDLLYQCTPPAQTGTPR